MIEYDNEKKTTLMYFAGDGSWGETEDLLVMNVEELDSHFTEFLEYMNEYLRPDFMRWYVDNQGHDKLRGQMPCDICDNWQFGTEDEIIDMLEDNNS
jgi:hypothetical protein